MQVLLDGQVEGVSVLEIHGHAEHLAHLFQREETAALCQAILKR